MCLEGWWWYLVVLLMCVCAPVYYCLCIKVHHSIFFAFLHMGVHACPYIVCMWVNSHRSVLRMLWIVREHVPCMCAYTQVSLQCVCVQAQTNSLCVWNYDCTFHYHCHNNCVFMIITKYCSCMVCVLLLLLIYIYMSHFELIISTCRSFLSGWTSSLWFS